MAHETCFLNTRRALCSSIGINAILFSVLLVLQYFYDIRKDDGNATEELGAHANGQLAKNYFSDFISVSDNTLCVKCGYLGENISAEETLYNQILISKNGSRMCCLEDGSLASLARKVLKIGDSEKPIDKDSFSWWRERPNSAHLYLKDWYRTQLHWTATEETGSAFSKLPIVDQNKLVIEKTGHYFVYAAVVFDFRTVTKVPQIYYNITSFLPVISRFTFVLMGKYGGSPFSEKRHTGYLCGISKFYKGHQISVSVSDHSFIDNTPYANFFGILML
ncbi:uncharacterized protein LOC128181001 [Crassostrea angulata]|uniref:uncharacterized protein LOC128181001 n=1 Tax=Magallana angulata TaxID=2784310 RepID=UPI0022B0AA11|nr:uncharacterized protein LOC128181001 [Crassostrea angulata]